VLGATSQIAKDLLRSMSDEGTHDVVMFSRTPHRVQEQFQKDVKPVKFKNLHYSEFAVSEKYDAIINFVGVGSPAQAIALGPKILMITEHYDSLALEYIDRNPDCKYVFMSSGAVYGGTFEQPADFEKSSQFEINNIKTSDYYAISKFYTEVKHRSINCRNIVDVRIFNYVSSTQNLDAGFFMTDIFRSIRDGKPLVTSPINFVRDFLTPHDFHQLIESILLAKPFNHALDCFTRKPIQKLALLESLKNEFGLTYSIGEYPTTESSQTGKHNYYSNNDYALSIGYEPHYSSLDGVISEIKKFKRLYCV